MVQSDPHPASANERVTPAQTLSARAMTHLPVVPAPGAGAEGTGRIRSCPDARMLSTGRPALGARAVDNHRLGHDNRSFVPSSEGAFRTVPQAPHALTSASDDPPLALHQILDDEYRCLHGGTAADGPASSDVITPESAVLRRHQQAEHTALCLSGGGVRSASFSLGVLQGLARAGVLGRFDYLSTVSGGGYVGGWLSAWRVRARDRGEADPSEQLAGTIDDGVEPPRGEPVEPTPLLRLRRLVRFLDPAHRRAVGRRLDPRHDDPPQPPRQLARADSAARGGRDAAAALSRSPGTAVAARAREPRDSPAVVLARLDAGRPARRRGRDLRGTRASEPRQPVTRSAGVSRLVPGARDPDRPAAVRASLLGVAVRGRDFPRPCGARVEYRHGRAVGGRRRAQQAMVASVDVAGGCRRRRRGTRDHLVVSRGTDPSRSGQSAAVRRRRSPDHAGAPVPPDLAVHRPRQPRHERRRSRMVGARGRLDSDRGRHLARGHGRHDLRTDPARRADQLGRPFT